MIHEATLGAGSEEEALGKKHTTTQQALDLVAQIKPWRSILTHFSCRYQHLSEILPGHTELKVMVALDHLRVSFSHLEFAYKYLDVLQTIFGEEDEPTSEKSEEEKEQPKAKKQKKGKK